MTASTGKDRMTMSRLRILATVTVLGLAGSGCAPTTSGLTPTSNPSLSSVHQPVVERTDFVFDVATSGGGVSPAELARLDAWFASIDVGYGDRVAINLAAMIANPNDLVLGQDGTVDANANTATRAIRTYRQRQPTGQGELPATSTTTGGNN
jgi:type IV pilus biogenesis protein CpaD/CtpE